MWRNCERRESLNKVSSFLFLVVRSWHKEPETSPHYSCCESPTSKPLRSRPIELCLEVNGDLFATAIFELKCTQLPNTIELAQHPTPVAALYEAHSSDDAVRLFLGR